MFPRVSSPSIMVTRGVTSIFGMEFVVPGTCHFMRLKSDIPSQVSSMLRKIFFLRAWARNSMAQRYLSTRFFSEFECRDTVLIFRYRMPRSSRITDLTSFSEIGS